MGANTLNILNVDVSALSTQNNVFFYMSFDGIPYSNEDVMKIS
jgi:hypothetical protein